MKRFVLPLLILSITFLQAQTPKTIFESSDGRKTATYDEAINYYKQLAVENQFINIKEVGTTDSGYPLHLVTLDLDKDFDFEKSYKKGKTILLINNGIHPGEPDGIEASMMLLRDYAQK
jgi:hypothetical protein